MKEFIIAQLIGYLLAILMSPISIRIIIDEYFDGKTFITFPTISFIVWGIFIVLPVLYAYIKRLEHRDVCFMVLWIPPVMICSICVVSLLMNIITILW